MEQLFAIGLLIGAGLIFARVLEKIKFPAVTGYILSGIVVGPYVLKLLNVELVDSLHLISEVALSFIAFSVGSHMNLSTIRKMGSKILIVTVCEALGAMIVVTLGCYYIFNTSLGFALVLGSIACATSPAATMMIIKQYNASGELVDALMPVVALDDAVGIIAYGVSSSIAKASISGEALKLSMLISPVKEIILALLFGALIGFIFALLSQKIKNREELLCATLAFLFGATALSLYFEISSLLTLMTMGFVISNVKNSNRRFTEEIDKVTPPIFISFFALSGANLNVKSILSIGLIGLFYVLGRVMGKLGGSYFSTKFTGFSKTVTNYLGLTLIPQDSVAIALSMLASKFLPMELGELIRTIVLASTFCYALVGPVIAKYAMFKSGTIKQN